MNCGHCIKFYKKNSIIFKTRNQSGKLILNKASKLFGKSHIVFLQALSKQLIPLILLIMITQTHFFD